MWQDDNEFIIRCGCHNPFCTVHLSFWADEIFNDGTIELLIRFSLAFHVSTLWRKIRDAFLYIFKHNKLLPAGEICLYPNKPEELAELKNLRIFLDKVIASAEKKP